MKYDAINQIGGAYGDVPTVTGAQTIADPVYAFLAEEDTTFGAFYDKNGTELAYHPWKGKTLKADKTAFLGQGVEKLTITAGGLGHYYLATDEEMEPYWATATTNATGTEIVVTFTRKMADPSADPTDFVVYSDAVADEVTAAALEADTYKIKLTLTSPILWGRTVTGKVLPGNLHTARGARYLQPSLFSITNAIPDVPPVLATAATNVAGTIITLGYDIDVMDPTGDEAEFTVTNAGVANPVTLAAWNADHKKIDLTLTNPVLNGEAVLISYGLGDVKSTVGCFAVAKVDQVVTNNVP